MVTPPLLTTPPVSIVIGTALPGGTPPGISKTISFTPTDAGEEPENTTFAAGTTTPPTRITGVIVV